MSELSVTRLTGAFGAEVKGVVLSEMGDNLFATLHRSWLDHDGLMVLRDQELTADAHVEFAARFGNHLLEAEPRDHALPGYPAIYHVDYTVAETPQPRAFVDTGGAWHAYYADTDEISGASILHVVEMAPKGGDIFFADLYAAYDALSPTMRDLLADLEGVHTSSAHVAAQTPKQAIHPIVRTHPETERSVLFISPGFTTEIVGLHRAESDALLGFLKAHVTQPAFIYRHHWVAGDVLVWDNRCTLHNALPDGHGGGRVTFNRVAVR